MVCVCVLFWTASAGLILVPPPIWVILCSVRTVVTTALYKFVLRRDVTILQFIGAGLIVASIIVAKLGKCIMICFSVL